MHSKHTLQSIIFIVGLQVSLLALAQPLSNRIDNIPMYGQPSVERPEALREADEKFIAEAVAGLGTREAASDAWWRQGEEFIARRNYDLAMRRYNQAWLLNPKSFRPYWGFARVLVETGNVEEASRQFDRSIELNEGGRDKPALLTDSASVFTFLGNKARNSEGAAQYYERARMRLAESLSLDPEYGNAYKRLAFLLFYEKNYAGGWANVKLARGRNDTSIPQGFVEELRRHMPEPQ